MRRTILVHGVVAGVLIAVLQLVEYRFLVASHALAIYGGVVAVLFAALGLWLGARFRRPPPEVVVREVAVEVPVEVPVEVRVPVRAGEPFVPDATRLARLGITPREHEILQLIAQGLSTREMAERLSVSENTVKTHANRLLDKLNARRRTQAVQLAKEAGLLP